MGKFTILVLVAATLSGCAGGQRPPQAPALHGYYTQGASPVDDKSMADDVARKLVALYPPAQTRIKLRHATPDGFGTALVSALRLKGYGLAEATAPIATAPGADDAVAGAHAAAAPGQTGDISLAYVVDQPLDASQYRVTVLVNEQSLTRLYQTTDGAIAPAGYWIRKE
jgi:hypothetical protein